ncbi:MAG: EAL domain-containing protein [Clostridia bacterium]|nr:EAL domain-containing protein [Clostridia bacterium]
MAFKWRTDKKKRKEDSSVLYGEEFDAENQKALTEETEAPKRANSFRPVSEDATAVTPFVPEEETEPTENPDPASEDLGSEASAEETAPESPTEPQTETEEPAPEEAESSVDGSEAAEESATSQDAPLDPEEEAALLAEVQAMDDGIMSAEPSDVVFAVAPAMSAQEEPTESESAESSNEASQETSSTPAEGNGEGEAFVMDDDYMQAFMAEGAMDDFVYGGNFEERQELLDQIADNAETLAEDGTEYLEKQEQEKEEAKKAEPKYNERGELLNEDGKAVLKRSLENKLALADTRERRYYNKLKNEILAYDGVKAEMQTATEVFRRGKQVLARLSVAGFTRIYFALDPVEFDVDRYKQADRSEVDFDDARMLLRVRNDDEFAIVIELLALMMGKFNISRLENPETVDYLPNFPRRSDAVLDTKGKYLSLEEKDEQNLIKEKRAEERKAAGLSEEPEQEIQIVQEEAQPLSVLPLTLENKIHQCPNTIKILYSKIKNELLSYKTVKSEMTVKNDNFKSGKKLIARITIVAEIVRLYLALDPKKYPTRKYKHKDASDQIGYEGTKLLLKIENEKERDAAVKLITELMKENGLERNKRYAYVPFAEKYPYIKNAVFKGEEDKPFVKREGEEYADVYGELTEHLREQMGATDAWGVPKGYKPDDGLTARDLLELQRSKAKTLNAGVALATPIVFFYDAAINEEGVVQYLNVYQVLNDKFLGKMIPQEYFAIAEGSSRIEELNYIALDNVVKDCNENPDIRFAVKISCRLLLKQETLTKLVDKMQTEHKNLILAFDCAMLEAVGYVGISAINTLKTQGALIMIDNAESASMRVLTEYEFDYLRLDARYYSGDSSKRLSHLDMITGYADVQNIVTTSINCEHKEEARILLDHGVKVIQGDAVARPMRIINLALTNIKPVPKVKNNGENKE